MPHSHGCPQPAYLHDAFQLPHRGCSSHLPLTPHSSHQSPNRWKLEILRVRVDQCFIIGDIFFCWVWIQQAKDYYITWEHISFAFSFTLAAPRFRSNSKVGNSSAVPIFITSPHVSTIPDSIINTFIMSKSVHPRLPRPAMPMTADAGGLEVSKTRWYCCGWPRAKKCLSVHSSA